MKSNIEMEISQKDLLNILSAYYSERTKEDITIKTNITSSLYFYYTTYVIISGNKVKITITLSTEEIKEALIEILKKANYSVEDIKFNTGRRLEGGNFRDECYESYFDGVTISLKPKEMQKILK